MPNELLFVILALMAIFALVFLVVFVQLFRPWLRAFLHGCPVSIIRILGMRLRGNPPLLVIDAYIALKRSGVSATIADVENAYIDGRPRISTSYDLEELVKKQMALGDQGPK